ncbi:MAG TPA: glycosyltransferase family 4 protein [Ktedonobacteraceae bacterium]
MKIAIVSDAIYPYNKGGKEKRIYEISTRLAKMGHEVTVYCMKWWKESDARMEEGVQIKAISPYFPLYSGERRSIKEALLFSLHCLKLVKEDFDIIDVDHMPHLVLFSTKVVALLKRKKLHVIWNEVWGTSYWINYMGPSGILASLIEKITSMLPDKFIAVSEHTARELTTKLKVPQRKITVVPNGISIAELEAIVPAPTRSDIIFVGRLLSHKNVDVLIQSVALLKTKYPEIKCVIVGRGPERNNLIELVQKHDLVENIDFIEEIEDHDQLYSLMKSSRVFAFPSTREGFGIVVLEANACGLPVITTDYHQNAARYLIEEGLNGKTISLSKEKLAHTIDLYMTTKPDSTRYTLFLQQFDWNNLAQKVESVYVTEHSSKTTSKEEPTRLGDYLEVLEMSAHQEVLVHNSKSVRKE